MTDQKIDNLLNLALEATRRERENSLELNVGYDEQERVWDLIVRHSGSITHLQDELVQITELTNRYAIVTIVESRISWLASRPEIEFIEKPKRLFFSVNQGRAASCMSALQTAEYGLLGQGILVAVIDSGVDYAHPDFRNEDGSTRILSLWDQTIAGNPPVGFHLGTEYSQEQINAALAAPTTAERYRILPSRDLSGHGTAVLGIAAGNGRASNGLYRGVAPESELLVVKLGLPREGSFPRTTELMQAVDYVIRKAEEYGRPVAVNLSFGTVYGSHDGTSLLETYLDDMASRGRNVIVVGTGNEGNTGGHISGILEEGRTEEIELGIANNELSINLQIWKSYVDEFDISVVHPSGESVMIPANPGTQRLLLGNTELLIYYGEPKPYTQSQEIYIDFLPADAYIDSGVWKIRLHPVRIVDERFDMWLPAIQSLNEGTRFFSPTVDTTLTIPATAEKVISVAAYDAHLRTYAPFSGRGYTRDGRMIKPDIAAPGVDITTTAPGGGYTTVSGTSFATPFVTGAATMLMQWGIIDGNDPYLYGEKVKAYLIRGARHLSAEREYPNPTIGWGTLCVRDSLP